MKAMHTSMGKINTDLCKGQQCKNGNITNKSNKPNVIRKYCYISKRIRSSKKWFTFLIVNGVFKKYILLSDFF